MKTLAKDEVGELQRTREQLVSEIESAHAKLQTSMEQLRRHHYHKLGELLIQLRMTFPKSVGGDREFAKFCDKEFPFIKKTQRLEYINYRKRLGSVKSFSAERARPPLRRVTNPDYNRNDKRDQYRRIVDDEVEEPAEFNLPRTKREEENEIVLDLAQKIVNAGFRVLSVKLHPDKDGGSNDAMRRLNAAKKLLTDALTRAELMM